MGRQLESRIYRGMRGLHVSVNVPADAVTPIREIELKLHSSQPYNGAIYLDASEY